MSDKNPASHDEHQKWHWAEGNKYAIEGIKTLLLLNGGSAVALLAFIGNWKEGPSTFDRVGASVVRGGGVSVRQSPSLAPT